MSSIGEIGALLGFVAFAGLAVLVFLTFQQARDLRRLRDWAGRAPERAAAMAASTEGDERTQVRIHEDEKPDEGPGRMERLGASASERWTGLDRRMPVDPKLVLGGLLAVVLGVGIATSAFGLLGDDGSSARERSAAGGSGGAGQGAGAGGGSKVEVAVLNGTALPGGTGVSGVADRLSRDVEGAGFEVGSVDNAGSYEASVVLFDSGAEDDAKELADALAPTLGETEVTEMTTEVSALAGGAELALVIGQDDSGI